MTTTAPSTAAPRLTDEDTLRADVIAAIDQANEDFYSRPIGNVMKDGPEGYWGHQADAAIAAAEPFLRARHRAELLAELIEAADRDPIDLLLNIPDGISAINAGAITADWLRQQADATRPVEGRGVK